MKLSDIRSIARKHSIKLDRLSKTALIKAIQTEEGNFACFATANSGACDQSGCHWREDCFATARGGELS